MASSVQSLNILKRHMRKTVMYVERLNKKHWLKRTSFTWHVDKFFELNESIVYTNKIRNINWNLALARQGDSVTVTLDTLDQGVCLNITCRVLYDENYISTNTSDTLPVIQFDRDLYAVTLPPGEMKSSRNWRLDHSGTLSLQFTIEKRSRDFFFSNMYKRDYCRMVTYVRSCKSMNLVMSDFTVKVIGDAQMINCHKAILAARSTFLYKYFKEPRNNANEELLFTSFHAYALERTGITHWLNALEFHALRNVITYLYFGKYFPQGKLELIQVIKVTWELDIPSLKTVCNKYITTFMNADNVHWFKERAVELGLTFLTEKADVFLAKMDKVAQRRKQDDAGREISLNQLLWKFGGDASKRTGT